MEWFPYVSENSVVCNDLEYASEEAKKKVAEFLCLYFYEARIFHTLRTHSLTFYLHRVVTVKLLQF